MKYDDIVSLVRISRGERKYLRLKKTLYGLKQAARQCNTDINISTGLSLGFAPLVTDSCIYELCAKYSCYHSLYVDGMGITA